VFRYFCRLLLLVLDLGDLRAHSVDPFLMHTVGSPRSGTENLVESSSSSFSSASEVGTAGQCLRSVCRPRELAHLAKLLPVRVLDTGIHVDGKAASQQRAGDTGR
jgi:hypothetical protein